MEINAKIKKLIKFPNHSKNSKFILKKRFNYPINQKCYGNKTKGPCKVI
jgi:hypothetical protein